MDEAGKEMAEAVRAVGKTRRVLRPRVSALLQAAVAELRAAGAEPSPEDVIWLHHLAERQVLPTPDDPPAFLPQPVALSRRLVLYPLTIEATMWLEERAVRWWPRDDLHPTAWAMAHCGGDPDAERGPFRGMALRAWAVPRVEAWARTLRISREKLLWGVRRLVGSMEGVELDASGLAAEESSAQSVDWGAVIARLSGVYHLPPQMFLSGLSMSDSLDMLRRAPAVSAVIGGSHGEVDPVAAQAYVHMRLVIRHLKARAAEKKQP